MSVVAAAAACADSTKKQADRRLDGENDNWICLLVCHHHSISKMCTIHSNSCLDEDSRRTTQYCPCASRALPCYCSASTRAARCAPCAALNVNLVSACSGSVCALPRSVRAHQNFSPVSVRRGCAVCAIRTRRTGCRPVRRRGTRRDGLSRTRNKCKSVRVRYTGMPTCMHSISTVDRVACKSPVS